MRMNMNNKTQPSLDEAFDWYIEIKKIDNLAQDTIISYTENFKYFYKYLISTDQSTLCSKITSDTMIDYTKYLENKRYIKINNNQLKIK